MLFRKIVEKMEFLLVLRKYSTNKSFPLSLHVKPTQSDKSAFVKTHYFSDSKRVRVVGGKGGDGCISFLQLWCNEFAGPDGGDGGNGGHIIFKSSTEVVNLNHLASLIKARDGEIGTPKGCNGENAPNMLINVPIGTIIRDLNGKIVCDLNTEHFLFIGARGGSGGKGNLFFANSKQTTPKVCECGPLGESIIYTLELRCMADIGLIGCPNVGKSTLLRAISRAKPKVAPYIFTTLRPHIGILAYDDHYKVAVADMPGLIAGSSQNKGLGIQILKHVERCSLLLFIIDVSSESPWNQYNLLIDEINLYNPGLLQRPKLIVANKVDVRGANSNVFELERRISNLVIPVSAKNGFNISNLLIKIREYHGLRKSE